MSPVVEGDGEVFTHAASLAEIVSKAKRRGKDPMDASDRVSSLSKFVSPTLPDSKEAGLIHAEVKSRSTNFSLADAFVLQAARKLGARVLTGDSDFRGIKESLLID